jgi:hypothetical protein
LINYLAVYLAGSVDPWQYRIEQSSSPELIMTSSERRGEGEERRGEEGE